MSGESHRQYGRLVLWGEFTRIRRSDFRRLRKELGSDLPPDYRAFIEVANGGVLPYQVDLPPGAEHAEPIGFSELHTVTPDPSGTYSWGTLIGEKRQLSEAYFAEHLPEDVLPIATDGGGSSLFIRLHPDHLGEVWAFVHGLPAWAGGSQQDTGGLVAASLGEFLDMLYIHDEMAEMHWRDAQGAEDWQPVVEMWLESGLPDWRSRPWATEEPQD